MRSVGGARRFGAVIAGAVVLAGLLAGCGQTVQGTATAAVDKIDVNSVAGLPITDSPDGPKQGAPNATLPVAGGMSTPEDTLAVNALSDVFEYWRTAMPKYFPGSTFTAPQKFNSYDSRVGGPEICQQQTKGLENAFYCNLDKSVSWDRGVLLPVFAKQFGPNSIATVLAHEMGHSVQYQLGSKSGITPSTPTIVLEQQADCYAGTFFRWAAEGHAKHFAVATGAGLNRILAALLFIGDVAGQSAKSGPSAHGSAFDRIYAFETGFSKDPTACAAINEQDVNSRSTEHLLNKQEQQQNNGDIDVEQALPMVKDSLDQAFSSAGSPSPQVQDGAGTCGAANTPPVSYCADDNSINVDMSSLQNIGNGSFPTGTLLNMAGKPAGGDFSAFAEFASRYTLSVQKHVGLSIDGPAAGLRSGCLTGAWAAYTNQKGAPGQRKLRLAAGDLDEAVAEMLQPNSVITDDDNGNGVRSGFARVEAFRIGFLQGSAQCSGQFG